MTDVPALAPLVDGQHAVVFSDEDYERLEEERIRRSLTKHTDPNAEINQKLDALREDMDRVLSVIAQLETVIAAVMPAIDQITENPAKFVMSLMSGGMRGGR